jgi:hypothetical protein
VSLLRELERNCLPSDFVQLPFAGHENRNVACIMTDYCFTLSSKERVPYHVLLGTVESDNIHPEAVQEECHDHIEQRLITRTLDRLNMKELKPDIVKYSQNNALGQDESFSDDQSSGKLLKMPKVRSRNSEYFYLENKGRGIFGDTSLKEIEEHVQTFRPEIKLLSLIVKSGDDLRQDLFASQLIYLFKVIFAQAKLDIWMRDVKVIPTQCQAGLIETIDNAISLDRLKKSDPNFRDLKTYFINTYGPVKKQRYKTAVGNFVSSMAGYSLFCYLFQVKDRHNGNILLDSDGHIIHVDFGFMMSNSPGSMNFEQAPFKLTSELIDVMGGQRSRYFIRFKKLMAQGFLALRQHKFKILQLVEIMMQTTPLPCFANGESVMDALIERFVPEYSKSQSKQHVLNLIERSCDNWRTVWYDKYSKYCLGIL